MKQLPIAIKRTITIGMLVLVLGSIITTYIVTKFNVIKNKKDQVVSLIYYIDYQTSS